MTHPPLMVSLARGMGAVGGSPPLLTTCFLAALVLWAMFSGYGVVVAASPAAMVLLESLPPVHALLDIQFLASGRTATPGLTLALGSAIVLLRSALLAFWISLILESLRGERGWRGSLRKALRRTGKSFAVVLALEVGFTVLVLVALFVLGGLGAGLGQLGVVVALLGGAYYLVLAPVIAVSEGKRTRDAVRLSVQTARLPGRRHLVLTFTYLALTFFISLTTPGSRVAQATPSFVVWLFVLFVSFLHISVLAALTFRWLVVGPTVAGGERPEELSPHPE